MSAPHLEHFETARERLAAALLKDRERRKDKPAASRSAPRVQQEAFDPFAITRWRVVAGDADASGGGRLVR
jgi:hypothetical protein